MRLQLDVVQGTIARGVTVTVDPTATVAEMAVAVARVVSADSIGDGLTVRVLGRPHVDLDPAEPVVDSGLRSGQRVELVPVGAFATAGTRGPAAARLRVLQGPDAGREYDLPFGSSLVGRDRDTDVRLTDPLVSKRHVRINVGATVEVVDQNSANGVELGGRPVSRSTVEAADSILIGGTVFSIARLRSPEEQVDQLDRSTSTLLTRAPRVVARFDGVKLEAPAPPEQPDRQTFPWIAMVAPVIMGVVLFLITRQITSVVFVALSPVIVVGTYIDHAIRSRRKLKLQKQRFESSLELLDRQVAAQQRIERAVRQAEHPSMAESVDAALRLSTLVWTRRAEHDEFLCARLGLAPQASRVVIELPNASSALPEFVERLLVFREERLRVADVPVVADLRSAGALGVVGADTALDVARGLVLQFAVLHAPGDLSIAAVTSPRSRAAWDWLRWLPHTVSGSSALKGRHLADDRGSAADLIGALERLIETRRVDRIEPRGPLRDPEHRAPVVPAVLVVVADDAPIDRARLIRLAETGPDHGVHVLWVAPELARLPAAARTFVTVTEGGGAVGVVRTGENDYPVALEGAGLEEADRVARALTAVVDAGATVDDEGALPSSVGLAALAGEELLHDPSSVVDRWTQNGSVGPRRTGTTGLRALVGSSADGLLHLDLRLDGPHALVGGTTGAGKSEFLQSWVLGLAASYSPNRLSFLFVDYKGGSAFADCVRLPHTVGLVTDLSPHLVQRAIVSLRAELRHREEILWRKGAKDLVALERTGDPETPPALVIVVDEFAALVQEMPEFLDGIIDIAQRGRALGLHLILATQRPAGVIRDSLRTNTNLRVALRMADAEDSLDVLGDALAAAFPPELPGRAAVKSGPGLPRVFQSAYAGARTVLGDRAPDIAVDGLGFDLGRIQQDAPLVAADTDEQTDLTRIVDTVVRAARAAEVPPPRRPWLDELAPVYEFTKLNQPRRDDFVLLGVVDRPERQEQASISYQPDRDGNLAVLGTGASGKSTVLRTIAVAAGTTPRGGSAHVYAIDAGARGLAMLEDLPHVGSIVDSDDEERVVRLLRMLQGIVEERAARYSAVSAGTVVDYRARANRPDEPRIYLLIDGVGAFRERYEFQPVFQALQQIAVDGRQVGVHLVLAGERPNALPASLGATVQRRLVLRMAGEDDYLLLGQPRDVLGPDSPPGRGLLDGEEVQVAVLGGTANLAIQARSIATLGAELRRRGAKEAPPVAVLGTDVPLAALPPFSSTGRIAIGLGHEDLEPVGVQAQGLLLVAGPAGSGRTTAVSTVLAAVHRATDRTAVRLHADGQAVPSNQGWLREAFGITAAAALAEQAADEIERGTWAAPVVAIDGIGAFQQTEAEPALERLIRVASRSGLVVAEDEPHGWSGYSPILQPFRNAKRGLVLAQGDLDADGLLGVSSGRASAQELPPGRGYLAVRGRITRLQVARPGWGEVPIDA